MPGNSSLKKPSSSNKVISCQNSFLYFYNYLEFCLQFFMYLLISCKSMVSDCNTAPVQGHRMFKTVKGIVFQRA